LSDFSITRFLPKSVSLDKVNSAQAGNNDKEPFHSFSEGGERREHRPEEATNSFEEGGEGITDDDELEIAVARLNDYVQTVQRDIIFGINSGGGEPTVTVLDSWCVNSMGEKLSKWRKKWKHRNHLICLTLKCNRFITE
jgi:uncharacterized FlaG/YvyC family protein